VEGKLESTCMLLSWKKNYSLLVIKTKQNKHR
jgi:hypothetical protein